MAKTKLLYADYVRVIATLAMILLHGAGDLLYTFDKNNMYDSKWWAGNLYDSAVRWCVPVFIMLSGSLLLSPSKEESIGDFLKKRMLRVAIPFLFWSAIYLAYDYRGYIRDHKMPWWPDVWHQFLFKDVYFHLWFVPMILGLYFLTPTFRVFIKAAKRVDIEYFLVFWFYVSVLQVSFSQFFLIKYIGWLAYIGYFVMGHYIKTYDIKRKKLLYLTAWLSLFLTIFGTWYLTLYFNGFHHDTAIFYLYLSPNVIFMGSAIFLYLKEYDWTNFNERNPRFHRFIEWFSSLSFGTYLIHALLLDVFKNGYLFGITLSSTNFFGIEGHPFWCVPMYVIIVTTLSLGLIWVLTKVPGLKKLVN
jgi:surface polysaccharide O-acyltransferase-like enzyme